MKKLTLLLVVTLILTACGEVKENVDNKENENVVIDLRNDGSIKNELDNSGEIEKIEESSNEVLPKEELKKEEKVIEVVEEEKIKKEEIQTEIPEMQTPSEEESKEVIIEYDEGVEVGKKAADFEVELLTGEKVKLSDYFGKPIFLNFWATWCGPCVSEMPDIEKIKKEYGDNLVVLLVNGGEEKEDVEFFVNRMKYTSLVGLDKTGEILTKYDSMYIPLSVFIDKDGIIRERKVGAMTEEAMRKIIEKLVNNIF